MIRCCQQTTILDGGEKAESLCPDRLLKLIVMYKKLMGLLLGAALGLSLCSCSNQNIEPLAKTAAEPTGAIVVETTIPKQRATIEETVLCDSGGIKITATDLVYDDEYGVELHIRIENESKQFILIQDVLASVNTRMVSSNFSTLCNAGEMKTGTVKLWIPEDKPITKITLSLNITEAKTGKPIARTDTVTIPTDVTEQEPDIDMHYAKVVYEDDMVKILVKENEIVHGEKAIPIPFFAYNLSDKTICVKGENFCVDDIPAKGTGAVKILPGQYGYGVLFVEALDDAPINLMEAKNIYYSFSVYDPVGITFAYDTTPMEATIK